MQDNKTEVIFGDGISFQKPRIGVPDYVKGTVSIKADVFVEFLRKHVTETKWINLDLKESKNGKLYFQLNTWKPKGIETKNADISPSVDPINGNSSDKIPF